MNHKNSKKSPIHENADANITCDFGDGDISRSRSFLSNPDDGQSRGLLKFISRYLVTKIIFVKSNIGDPTPEI